MAAVVVGLAALIARVTGRGRRIRGHHLRSAWLSITAALILLAEPWVEPKLSHAYPIAMVVASGALCWFCARNVGIPGVPLATVGVLLNTLVVLGNGAMPVEDRGAVRAGISIDRLTDYRHFAADPTTRFRGIDDRVAVPIPGHREVDSPGDLAFAAGAGLFAFTALRRRRGVFDPIPALRRRWAS